MQAATAINVLNGNSYLSCSEGGELMVEQELNCVVLWRWDKELQYRPKCKGKNEELWRQPKHSYNNGSQFCYTVLSGPMWKSSKTKKKKNVMYKRIDLDPEQMVLWWDVF